MNYNQVAEDVVKHIGGKENVSHFEHCSTRLRFSLVGVKSEIHFYLTNVYRL